MQLLDPSSGSSWPSGKQKPVCNPRLPNLRVAQRAELSSVTAVQADIMRQVIIQAEIKAVCVRQGKRIAGLRSSVEELLNPGDGLEPANTGEIAAGFGEAIGAFEPVTFAVRRVRELAAYIEWNARWLP